MRHSLSYKGTKRQLCTFVFAVLFAVQANGQSTASHISLIGEYEAFGKYARFGFSPRGTLFYSLQQNGTLAVRTVADQSERLKLDNVRAVSFSTDDKLLLALQKRQSQIISTSDGRSVAVLERRLDDSRSVDWSKVGNKVAGWVDSYNVGVFDALNGRLLHLLQTHQRRKLAIQRLTDFAAVIPVVVFSPDGNKLMTIYGDKEAEVWDVSTGTVLFTLADKLRPSTYGAPPSEHAAVEEGSFSPDGNFIYTAGIYGGRLWKAQDGTLVKELDGSWMGNFSSDSRHFGPVGLVGSKASQILDLRTMKMVPLGSEYSGSFGVFSPDGNFILQDRTIDEVNKEQAFLFETSTGKLLWSVKTDPKYCFDLVSTCISDSDRFEFSPDSSHIAISNRKYVHIVSTLTGKLESELTGSAGPAHWSMDGKMMLTRSSTGGRLRLNSFQ